MPEQKDGYIKYLPADKGKFPKDGYAWTSLNKGYQVTANPDGAIIDIWNPTAGKLYDVFGNVIGARAMPYPLPQSTPVSSMTLTQLIVEKDNLRAEIIGENDTLTTVKMNISYKKKRLTLVKTYLRIKQTPKRRVD